MEYIPDIAYEEIHIVRTYEIDSQKRMTIPALINMMQEMAMQNVLELKASVWDLEPFQISWVLMRLHLQIARLPILGEQIRIYTIPAGFQKFFTYRDYKVFDAKGELIAFTPSTWLLMDTNTRRMKRIPEHILSFEMPDPASCLPRINHKLPPFIQADSSKQFEVQWHDLDFNEHLSNVYYIRWMLDSMEEQVLLNSQLTNFDIAYRAECRWKDQVRSDIQRLDEQAYLHRLVRLSDQKELAVATSNWQPSVGSKQ